MEHLLYKEKRKSKMEEMIISTTTKSLPNQPFPTYTPWKLYHNPIFTHHKCYNCTQIRSIHRPKPSAFRSLGFTMAATTKQTKPEIETARSQIMELKAELELERKMRKKVESIAKKMAKELAEERRGRSAAERVCLELESKISHHKMEIDRIAKEMDEERRMLRVAEVIREERVQMKLEDAKLFYEERLSLQQIDKKEEDNLEKVIKVEEERKRWVSDLPENPHIKRGIKGFVEFPRGLVRAMGSNKSNSNYKIECQKAQLRILLKQKSIVQPNSLVIS